MYCETGNRKYDLKGFTTAVQYTLNVYITWISISYTICIGIDIRSTTNGVKPGFFYAIPDRTAQYKQYRYPKVYFKKRDKVPVRAQ
jgi:hypothetical protein